jgi:hypothetical protein
MRPAGRFLHFSIPRGSVTRQAGATMRTTFALSLFFVLAGCTAQGPSQADLDADIARDRQLGHEQCAARFPISPRTNHVAQARCYNEYFDAVIMPRMRDHDLGTLINAKRLATAEQADKGLLTDAEVEVQMAEVIAYANSESQRRINSSAQTQAQITTARAAQSQAISAASSANPVPPQTARGCWRENNIMVCH